MPNPPDSPPSSPKLPLALSTSKARTELQATPKQPLQDVVLLHGPTEDGEGIRVVRAREQRPEEHREDAEPACVLEVGEVRPMKEGKPIAGEVVRLTPRAGSPRICDVEVMAKIDPAAASGARGKGPAQVATDVYRASWDRIFGSESQVETREDRAARDDARRALN